MNSELSSYFRKYLPTDNSSTCLVLNEGAGKTVARIIDDLGIPPEEPQIIMINREASSREHLLKDGDLLGLFPVAWGG
jgi:sulfur carrier protein ThiS